MHAQILKRADGLADTGEDGLAHMFDEHVLRGRCAALHPVEHDHIRPRLDRKRGVEIGACATDLDIDRHFPCGDFAQFQQFDFQIVRPGPVRVTASRALVDALGQVAHLGHAVRDFLTQEHAAAAGFGPLAHDHFDRIGAAQVIWVHAIAGGQVLIDQFLGMAAFLGRHAAVAGGGRGASQRGTAPQSLFGGAGKCAKAHACDGDRDVELDGVLGVAGAEGHRGVAAFAVAFERVARDRRAQEQQVVEMRHLAFGSATADVIDAGGCRAADFGVDRLREGRRLDRLGARSAVGLVFHGLSPQYALSGLKL